MPKTTFLKLNEAKRKAFLHEAYREFALHSFEAASITNLVRSLGIAKGSVYQYFDDKEELYEFLIKEADRQLQVLLDKTCVYMGEDFYDWFTKLIMVEVKFLLSFPQFAVLFQKLRAESSPSIRLLSKYIEETHLSRIAASLPSPIHDSTINNILLTHSPLLIFEMLTENLNLNQIVNDDEPIYLDPKELVSVCTSWVEKLRDGI